MELTETLIVGEHDGVVLQIEENEKFFNKQNDKKTRGRRSRQFDLVRVEDGQERVIDSRNNLSGKAELELIAKGYLMALSEQMETA